MNYDQGAYIKVYHEPLIVFIHEYSLRLDWISYVVLPQ